jgi:hypothetical protein
MRALLLAMVAAALACTPDFQSQSQVIDLRVLAVTAEPPEAQFDLDAGTVEPVKLTYLVADPARPDNFATLTAQACEPTDTRRCDQGLAFPLGTVSRQGGTLFTSDLTVAPSVLLQAASLNDLGAFNGIQVQVSFSVDDGNPAGPQEGDKVVVYTPVGSTPNHNPLMTEVDVSIGGVPHSTLQPGQELDVQPNVDYGLRPVLAPDARETYTTVDLKGKPVTLTEDPTYFFFTTQGASYDRDSAPEPDNGVAPPDGLTRFTAGGPGSGMLWIVVRDGRGGETWLTFPWKAN